MNSAAPPHPASKSSAARRTGIFVPVLIVHMAVILGPLALVVIADYFAPPEVNAFRVKIGGRELSHAPEVGNPERTRPDGREPAAEPKVEPKPERKNVVEPKVTAPRTEPKVEPKPQPKPQPKPKPKPKSTTKSNPKPATKTAAKPKPKSGTRSGSSRPSNVREAQQQVYQGGGKNYNPNVPIGGRNTGQAAGKADNRTPGGGRDAALDRYLATAGRYLKTRWVAPPRSLLGNQLPEVLIELEIAADGRVRSGRIVRGSGVAAMDDSVKRLLSVLDRIPTPPSAMTLQFIMRPEE